MNLGTHTSGLVNSRTNQKGAGLPVNHRLTTKCPSLCAVCTRGDTALQALATSFPFRRFGHCQGLCWLPWRISNLSYGLSWQYKPQTTARHLHVRHITSAWAVQTPRCGAELGKHHSPCHALLRAAGATLSTDRTALIAAASLHLGIHVAGLNKAI